MVEYLISLLWVAVLQVCTTVTHWIMHFKWVQFIVLKLYVN